LKILLVHRYIKPEATPCSNILFEIARFLSRDNLVDVLSSFPTKNNHKYTNLGPIEIIKNLRIFRIHLLTETNLLLSRVLNAIKLSFHIMIKSLKNNYDIIIVTSTPPILCAFITSVIVRLKKKRLIYYCMDLNPEISLLTKDLKKKLFYKFLLFLDNFSCKTASPVIVHSEDMLKTLKNRKGSENYNLKILNNFGMPNDVNDKNKNFSKINQFNQKKKLTLVYAGNIGRFQDFDIFINAFKLLPRNHEIKFLIIGEGVKKNNLRDEINKAKINIKIFNYMPANKVKTIIKKSDLGIVTLINNMHKYAYPSKLLTYLQLGVPVLTTTNKNSDITKDIISGKCGFWIPKNNPIFLSNLLIKLSKDKNWREVMTSNAQNVYKKKFSSKVILDKWKLIIENH
jgi:glycosyltransferase involved in cell wall biosynthesis